MRAVAVDRREYMHYASMHARVSRQRELPAFYQFVTVPAAPAGSRRGWSVSMLADAFGVSADSYSEYLRAFAAWAPKPKGRLHTCHNPRTCQCGKFSSVLKRTRASFHQAGDHIPDPNLDPSFEGTDPDHGAPVNYTSPFSQAVPSPAPEQPRHADVTSSIHPLQFLFGTTTIADFARYLGAPIGSSLSRITAFVEDRRNHALSLHRFLPYIGKRAGYLILRFIAVARANFLPSVTHPDHVAGYANGFDVATARAWLELIEVPAHDPLA